MNTENIDRLINFIKRQDTKLNMEYAFGDSNKVPDIVTCSTPMCIAGIARYLENDYTTDGNNHVMYIVDFLDIEYEDAYELCAPWEAAEFHNEKYDDEVNEYVWWERLTREVNGKQVPLFSKESVLKTLKLLKETGSVSWECVFCD